MARVVAAIALSLTCCHAYMASFSPLPTRCLSPETTSCLLPCSLRGPWTEPASVSRNMAAGDGGESGEESLSVKIFREQLERKWMLSRIKAKTVFLPFEEAVKWTRALGWWESKEEWQEWIEWGELKNPYIPSNPERYYGERGEWKGWDYWLGVRSGCSPEGLVEIATRQTEDADPTL